MIKSYERIDTGKEAYEQEGVKCINTRSEHDLFGDEATNKKLFGLSDSGAVTYRKIKG